jgi:hypothetical protein
MAFCLSFCHSSSKKDIRNYYFPLKELKEGLVYEYQPVEQDSLTPNYWFYRSYISKEGIYLTGTYYEYELLPFQVIREELVQNGMLTQEVFLYERPDSTGRQERIAVDILENSAFPFEVSDSGGIFLYKISYEPVSDPGASITLVKNRKYRGDTTFVYNEERYDAVVMDVKELIEYDKEGVFEQTYTSTEIYAKGLGLVYYDKRISDELAWAYRLESRYPMEELEEKFKQRIEQIE